MIVVISNNLSQSVPFYFAIFGFITALIPLASRLLYMMHGLNPSATPKSKQKKPIFFHANKEMLAIKCKNKIGLKNKKKSSVIYK